MILARGAEAIITKDDDIVRKERPRKSYRHEDIDGKLRRSRTRREAHILEKLQTAEVPAPKLIAVDDRAMSIDMSFIDGTPLRDLLERNLHLAKEVGRVVGKLHKLNIIHADLTTSNMLVKDNAVHLIDFGLSFFSTKVEDRAVDLHVLDHAMRSTHHAVYEKVMDAVFLGYGETYPEASGVFERLKKVELRGRNKRK